MKRIVKNFQNGFGAMGLAMVAATIVLVSVVAFRFLDAQNNTEVASNTTKPQASHQEAAIAPVNTTHDVDTVVQQIEAVDVDTLAEANLDAELNF